MSAAKFRPKKYRTKVEKARIKERLIEIVEKEIETNGVGTTMKRRIAYIAEGLKLIEKTDSAFDWITLLQNELIDDGDLHDGQFSDESRQVLGDPTWKSGGDYLDGDGYNRPVMDDVRLHIQVWVEKRGLGPILRKVTDTWHIRVHPVGGFSGRCFMHEAAAQIARAHRLKHRILVLVLTDHDPSGFRIASQLGCPPHPEFPVQPKKPHLCLLPRAERIAGKPIKNFEIRRLGLTQEQIDRYGVPEQPTKIKENAHAKIGARVAWPRRWNSAELDGLEPDDLLTIVRNAIEAEIAPVLPKMTRALAREQRIRDAITLLADTWRDPR